MLFRLSPKPAYILASALPVSLIAYAFEIESGFASCELFPNVMVKKQAKVDIAGSISLQAIFNKPLPPGSGTHCTPIRSPLL
jgi:hypothetical protein